MYILVFHKYDTEKNGFISSSLLDQVINELTQLAILKNIPTTSQLKQRMDPDNLQIITESSFFQELFPQENSTNTTNDQMGPLNGKPFVLYHYNGLPRSNKDKKVRYASVEAIISDYGYENDTPASAVAPVQPGYIYFIDYFFSSKHFFLCFSFFVLRKLFTNNRCFKN
jgi:hypothetical protein